MLVLSRRIGEKITVGDNITITVSRVRGERVSLSIEAPPEIRILRGELKEAANVPLNIELEFDHSFESTVANCG